jgi:RNA polymerase sigma-70 factor, ECF subfamily
VASGEDWLHRVLAGEAEAYGPVVERERPGLVALARGIVGDSDAAEDIAQQALVLAYVHLSSLREAARFRGWVRATARRLALRRLRRAPPPVADPAWLDELAAPDGAGVSDLPEWLEQLPPAEQQAAALFYGEEWTIDEVAGALHVPEGTVKRRLHDARQRLRRMRAMEATAATEDVSALVGLGVGCPPGSWVNSVGGDVEFLYLSVPQVLDLEGPDGAIVVWLPTETRRAVQPDHQGASAGARTLDGVLAFVRSAGLEPESVVLDCTAAGQLRASASVRSGGETRRVDLVGSLGLALAIRSGCPLYATPRLMARGVVGEGAEPGCTRTAIAGHKAQFRRSGAWNEVVDRLFACGFDPARGSGVARLVRGDDGALAAFLDGDDEPCATWPLATHGPALEHLEWCAREQPACLRQVRGGALYEVAVAREGQAWLIRFRVADP